METTLENLKKQVLSCKKCELHLTRTNPVFWNGNPKAKIMIIWEWPWYYEDQQGVAFVGKSWKLLDKILDACWFSREKHIFIANIVKCRPPNNRDPLPEERDACIPYLYKQIELINPKIIILLWATALKWLIDPNAKITKVRWKCMTWNDRLVMPTYHPSALLRNPKLKVQAWEDFKNVVVKYRELVDDGHISEYC